MVREHLIGIRKFPGVAGKLTVGRIYVAMHDAGFGQELVGKTLVSACATGLTQWVAEEPSVCLDFPAELRREVEACLDSGLLRIFRAHMDGEGDCLRVLSELDFLGGLEGGLVVVGNVDCFIEQADVETLEDEVAVWQRWAERSGCAVLWLCQTGYEARLKSLAHRFSGLVRLRRAGEEVRWDVYYWFTSDGLMVDKSFHLDTDGDGDWWVNEREMLHAEASGHAVDEDEVYAMREALPGMAAVPEGWHVFDSIGELEAALVAAHAPTVIINFSVGSSMEVLAGTIYKLRGAIGPYIKIVVKGEGGQLRHSHEHLLLSVGANLMIAGESGFARMLSQLKSIQGHVYSKSLPLTFEEAMASFTTTKQAGYLAPAEFGGAVADVMARTRTLEVNNVLVRLALTPGLGALETLRCCVMKRPGDLCTADAESVYVFLFSCEEQHVSLTLGHLFQLPVSVLFSSEVRYLSSEDIAEALHEFNRRAAASHLEDWTGALFEHSSANALAVSTAQVGNIVQAPARRAFTAVPHRLPLRAAQQVLGS